MDSNWIREFVLNPPVCSAGTALVRHQYNVKELKYHWIFAPLTFKTACRMCPLTSKAARSTTACVLPDTSMNLQD